MDGNQNVDGEDQAPAVDDDVGGAQYEDDGPWYIGRARDEFNRRRRGQAAPGDDDDPVQVSSCIFLNATCSCYVYIVGARTTQRRGRNR